MVRPRAGARGRSFTRKPVARPYRSGQSTARGSWQRGRAGVPSGRARFPQLPAGRAAERLDWCWRFIPELFEVDETLEALIDRGVAPDPRSFEGEYRSAVAAVLNEAQLEAPAEQRPILGGRRGHHSEHLGHLLAVMQFLPRTYPDAKW